MKILKKNSGFSLIELLVAVIIVEVFLVGMLQLFSFTQILNTNNRRKLQAINLAEDLLDEIRIRKWDENCEDIEDRSAIYSNINKDVGEVIRSDFDDIDDYDGLTESPPKKYDGSNIPNAGPFIRKVEVNYLNETTLNPTATPKIGGASGTNYKQITVTIEWEDSNKNTREHSVSIILSNHGIES